MTEIANYCIPTATTIPKKSKPLFDEECWYAWNYVGTGQESSTESKIEMGNHICFLKVTGKSSVYLQPDETSVMGRICVKAANWYSYKACVG